MKIDTVEVYLVDIPTIRPHKLSFTEMFVQNTAVVRISSSDGVVGLGEVCTIGGPAWGAESTETVKTVIDTYLAPALLGADPRNLEVLALSMDRVASGNAFAKAAVEMALVDLTARALGQPAWALLGGRVRASLPCAWTLACSDAARDAEEAEAMIESGRHRIFKIKIGGGDPRAEVARMADLRRRLGEDVELRVDLNQAWDMLTARRYVPALDDAGISVVEQPVAARDLEGLVALQAGSRAAIMADESVATPADALRLARCGGVDALSLKPAKSGGLLKTRSVAAVADAAGTALYGGTMLEGSIGTAAAAHLFATLPRLALGCELFGPLLVTDGIVEQELAYADGALRVPDGPGFGVTIDPQKLARYRRA